MLLVGIDVLVLLAYVLHKQAVGFQLLIFNIILSRNNIWHMLMYVIFSVPLSNRPYLTHVGLRTTIASIMASLALIQVSNSFFLHINEFKYLTLSPIHLSYF